MRGNLLPSVRARLSCTLWYVKVDVSFRERCCTTEGRLRNAVALAGDESLCLPSLLSSVAVTGVSFHLGRMERKKADITHCCWNMKAYWHLGILRLIKSFQPHLILLLSSLHQNCKLWLTWPNVYYLTGVNPKTVLLSLWLKGERTLADRLMFFNAFSVKVVR